MTDQKSIENDKTVRETIRSQLELFVGDNSSESLLRKIDVLFLCLFDVYKHWGIMSESQDEDERLMNWNNLSKTIKDYIIKMYTSNKTD